MEVKIIEKLNPVIQLRQVASQPNAEPSNTTSESGFAAKINLEEIIGRGYTGEGKSKMIYGVKRHWPTILIAVVLGILMVLPFFYFQAVLGDEYKGILNQIIDDETFYMARIKDIRDGHPTLGNAYLYEHKNQLPQQLFLPEFLLAQPLKFLQPSADPPQAENLDMVQARIFYSFILTAIAFILTYIAFYKIYPSRFWANLFSVFLFFGIFLFKFTRPVIPQFVFLFWLTQFILLWSRFFASKKSRILDSQSESGQFHFDWLLLLNILNFGLLFYLYPFYWTFYFVFLVVLILVFYKVDKNLSKQFLKVLIAGLIIGSFYFYLSFLASQLPEYQETLTRLQLVFSRSPSEIKSVALSLAVLLLMGILYRLKRIKISKEILFFIAGILSILIVTNQNIITGQKFEFGHYRMPAVFFLVFAVYYLWSKFKLNFRFKLSLSFLMIIASTYGIYGYAQRVFRISERDIYVQKYEAVFDWLNKNILSDSVVYANEEISELIPVYTSNNVFYSRYANLFIMPDKEAEERFIFNNFFEEFDKDFVIKNERSIFGVRYIDRYGDAVQANKWRKLFNLKLKDETRLPENEIERILIKAEEIQRNPPDKSFKKYRVDYFIWDKSKNPNWEPEKFKLKPAYNSENIYIFRFND